MIHRYINLASARLGAKAVFATDDFFADKQRMLQDTDPQWIEDKYDDHGKWMDGWESRRKRTPGHDYCDVKLARAGFIHAFVVDTSYFTGNYPPEISIDACTVDGEIDSDTQWETLVQKTPVNGDSVKTFELDNHSQPFTHVRLHIYPDGGVARLRVYGEPQCNWEEIADNHQVMDLGSALNGAKAILCSDEHFGKMNNILLPDKGINMGDGWETARRRGEGYDWVVIALAHVGVLEKIIVDTAFFKGNYPDRCSIQGACLSDVPKELEVESEGWLELLPEQKLEEDAEHIYDTAINNIGAVSHIRLNIFPDGGVSRLRLLGVVAECES